MSKISPPVTGQIFWSALSRTTNISRMSETLSFPTFQRGSNLVVTGHSLGGMVAQQVAADSTIKKNYNVLNTVTFGSPLINGFQREGTVKRLGDTSDPVPYLSLTTFTNIVLAVCRTQ